MIVLDPDADPFVRQVQTRLVGHHHAGLELCLIATRIMSLETQVMTETVDEVLPEALSLAVTQRRLLEDPVREAAQLALDDR